MHSHAMLPPQQPWNDVVLQEMHLGKNFHWEIIPEKCEVHADIVLSADIFSDWFAMANRVVDV